MPCEIKLRRWMRANDLAKTGAHTERLGGEDGVLTRRPLAVGVSADDKPTAGLSRPLGEGGIEAPEDKRAHRLDVRAQRHHDGAVRCHVAGRDFITNLDEHLAGERIGQRRLCGGRLDIRTAHQLYFGCLVRRQRRDDLPVIGGGIAVGQRDGRLGAEIAGVRNDAAQGGGRRGGGAA